MAKKRKRKRKVALIPEAWKTSDGISTLPDPVRSRVKEVLDKLSIGEPQQDKFFDGKFSLFQRQQIGYELNMAGVTYQDIATLLGLTISGAFQMLQRAFAEAAQHLPQNWLPNNFVDDYYSMKSAAQLNRARSLAAVTEESQIAFSRNEITARGKAMDALLKAGEIAKQFKTPGENGSPDANDRESTMQWVFENKIMPQLEAPKPEAIEEEAQVVKETTGEENVES